jgi:hypothetical protein
MLQDCDDRQLRVRAVSDEIAQGRSGQPPDPSEGFHHDRTRHRHVANHEIALQPGRSLDDAELYKLVDQLPRSRLAYVDGEADLFVRRATSAACQLLNDEC